MQLSNSTNAVMAWVKNKTTLVCLYKYKYPTHWGGFNESEGFIQIHKPIYSDESCNITLNDKMKHRK